MLHDYLQDYYLPAAAALRRRRSDDAAVGRGLVTWHSRVTRHWQGLHWDRLRARSDESGHHVSLHLYLDDLKPDDVQVECFADESGDRPAEHHVLQRSEPLPGTPNGFAYRGVLPPERPLEHYTPRLIPAHPEARVPLEINLITWIEGNFGTDD
jgi:starch phosphorylase